MIDIMAKEAIKTGFRRVKNGNGWCWRLADKASRRKINRWRARMKCDPVYADRIRKINDDSRLIFGRRMFKG